MMTPLTLVNVLSWLAQTTVVIAAGLLLLWAIRIDAPATRHAVLRGLLVFCLILPAIQPRVPVLLVPDFISPELASSNASVSRVVADPRSQGWRRAALGPDRAELPVNALVLLIVAGIIARLAWTAAGVLRLRTLRRAGEIAPADGEHGELQALIRTRAAIRYVPGLGQPVTFGFRRPVVLLPARLRHLPPSIQRAVVAHELWHVRRRDWMWTVAEETLRATLWFHPAMWVLLSRIQATREEVVDELSVLTTGSRKSYLDALLTFADERPLFAAAAFARRRHLVRRLLLISKESVMSSKRIVLSSLALAAAVIGTGWYSVLAFPLMEQQGPPRDPVRAPSEVRADAERAEKEAQLKERVTQEPTKENYLLLAQYSWERAFRDTSLSDSVKAEYVAQGIAAADSALAQDPDYVEALIYKNILLRVRAQATPDLVENRRLVAEADHLRNRAIELRKAQTPDQRRIMEAKIYDAATSGAQPPPPPPPPPAAPVDGVMPLRVGKNNLGPPVKIHDVQPEYPPIAKASGVQGVVVMDVVIDASGAVREARVLRSIPLLDKAAIDAVQQWRFQPPLLNGQPMPVVMTVSMSFALD